MSSTTVPVPISSEDDRWISIVSDSTQLYISLIYIY